MIKNQKDTDYISVLIFLSYKVNEKLYPNILHYLIYYYSENYVFDMLLFII